jgi:undecaprenyl diphosphate synthase
MPSPFDSGIGAPPLLDGRRDPGSAVPKYVAIIADGNGRWAQARGRPVRQGHEAGAETLKARLHDAIEFGIEQLTVFFFSTENWTRPKAKIQGLIEMLAHRIRQDTPDLHRRGVLMRFIGRREDIPQDLLNLMDWAEDLTASNHKLRLFIAVNYGFRAEIVDTVAQYNGGGEAAIRRCLYAPEMRDPELVIRTGGEKRLSNFLLWQAAFAQLAFRDELWPDFTRAALEETLADFDGLSAAF